MEELINALVERLKQNTNIRYVDENWGQLDYYSPNFPVQWPCVLIDVSNARFSNIGKDNTQNPANRQMGDLVVELRIANLKLSNTSGRAPASQKNMAHSIFSLIEEVHTSMQGYNATVMSGNLIRTTQQRVKRDDGVQEYAVNYSLVLNNC